MKHCLELNLTHHLAYRFVANFAENRKAPRSHPPQVFARKKFFLDLRPRASNSGVVKQLVEEIKILGGVRLNHWVFEASNLHF
jgi:hypothetical protein